MSQRLLHGLYAITDPDLIPPGRLVATITLAVRGGARLIQYRNKSADAGRRQQEAASLATVCRRYAVPFMVNDDVELAAAVAADGVHLGRDDPQIAVARHILGPHAIIGVSCYNQLARGRAAATAGADYLAFGRFYPSRTKPAAVSADLDVLRAARAEFSQPLVAIGGITPENGSQLIEAGADMLAVIHGVFGQKDPEAAARRYAELFENPQPGIQNSEQD
jgi:thiamine-phosphate pyrophosphorylase